MKTIKHVVTGREIPEFLTGVITPMFTACNEDGSLDEKGIRAMVDWFRTKKAVTTLFPRCGVGKMYTFTFEEVKAITDIVLSQADGDIYVMPGTAGEYDHNPEHKPDPGQYTEQSIELSLYAQQKGATAVVLVVPSALRKEEDKPLADTIFEYYEKVNAAIDIPIVVYQPPGLESEYSMTTELIRRLTALEHIAGMKYSTTDLAAFTRIAVGVDGTDFGLIAGAEHAFIYAMLAGAMGVIGQGSDLYPEILRAVFDHFQAGRWEDARQAQFDVNRALYACRGLDSSLIAMLYWQRKGLDVQPYVRGRDAYALDAAPSVPEERVDELERLFDEYARKYGSPS